MKNQVAGKPTSLAVIKDLVLSRAIRRNAALPSLPSPDAPAQSLTMTPAPSADLEIQECYDASSDITEAQRIQSGAERLGRKSRSAVQVADSNVAWEAAATTITLLNDVVSGLHTFSQAIASVSEVHPYVRAATSAINAIVKPIINQDARDDAFDNLLQEMVDTYTLVKKQFDPSILTQTCSHDQSVLLVKILEESEKCAKFIRNEYAAKNFWARAAKNAIQGGSVDAMLSRFRASFSNLRANWREHTLSFLAIHRILDQLKPSPGVGHSTLKACLPETRLRLLRQVSDRIRDEASRPFFVVGVAGSGKSSIAHSTAIDFERTGELGCFFQFDRSERDRTASRLIPTIAHALAVRHEDYRTAVVRLLQTTTGLAATNDINVQWRALIQEAGKTLTTAGLVLLVVDAFDECPQDDSDTREHLLKLLIHRMDDFPANVRVLITSRLVPGIARAIASTPFIDIGPVSAHDDIRRYVRSRLPVAGPAGAGLDDVECNSLADAADNLFQWAATACRYLELHPGGMTIREKFIHNRHRLMGGHLTLPGHPSLDSLYGTVLSHAFDVESDLAMGRYRSVMAMVLSASPPLPKAALDLLYRLATDPAGSTEHSIVESVLNPLGVVITGTSPRGSLTPSVRDEFPSDAGMHDPPIRLMHTSFRDFMVDRTRSNRWYISPEDILRGHRLLAVGALRHQARNLAFNMCGLPSSHTTNAEIHDLRWRLDTMLPAGLEYSACFWEHHVATILEAEPEPEDDGRPSTDCMEAIRVSLRLILLQRFPFWLELLSLCGRVEHAARSLSIALKVFIDEATDMREFLTDAIIFARHFCSVMSRSAPHVYLSALPFTPGSSLIRRRFLSLFPGLPVAQPLLPFWPIARDRIVVGIHGPGDWLFCIMCTPDLKLLAGSKDGTVFISNAENPHDSPSYLYLEPGNGPPSPVHAIAYSSTFRWIAVGYEDGVIRLWNSTSRQLLSTLIGHTKKVTSVAFTSDETLLVSGSADSTVVCWQLPNGTLLRRHAGHGSDVTGVACAADGRHIYSSSLDSTIRIWDLTTGEQVGDPLHCGYGAISMSYSPVRRCIAVGIFNHPAEGDSYLEILSRPCIQLWDMDARSKLGELSGHKRVVSVSLSPDGRHIASASQDMSIRLWDAEMLSPIGKPILGSTGGVRGVAFSPDGQTLFSSACDCQIRIWNVASVGTTEQQQIGAVEDLSYSTDGRFLRAQYDYGQVRFWETQHGAPVPEPVDITWREPTLSSLDQLISVRFEPCAIVLEDSRSASGDRKLVTLFQFHAGGFRGDLMPERLRFAGSSWADEIRVWDLGTAAELCEKIVAGGPVNCLAISPDGTEVASGMFNSTVRIWPIERDLGFHEKYPCANFTPKATVDEHGVAHDCGSLRVTEPVIYIPEEYRASMWQPRMRLLLNTEPFSVDFANACYGTDWDKCYSGSLPPATLEELTD